jgi:hypothetical protein
MSQENIPRDGLAGSCPTGKRTHLTRADAKRHARNLRLEKASHVRPYQCLVCSFWHVGHLPAQVMRGVKTTAQVYRRRRGAA